MPIVESHTDSDICSTLLANPFGARHKNSFKRFRRMAIEFARLQPLYLRTVEDAFHGVSHTTSPKLYVTSGVPVHGIQKVE